MSPQIIVMSHSGPTRLRERTIRALHRLGYPEPIVVNGNEFDRLLQESCVHQVPPGPIWLLSEGAWCVHQTVTEPPPSATGRALVALGRTMIPGGIGEFVGDARPPLRMTADWMRRSQLFRGSLQDAFSDGETPIPDSLWFDAGAADLFRARLQGGSGGLDAVRWLLTEPSIRRVHWPTLDVCMDSRLRVSQIITSLQRGGAERVAIDLHQGLLQRPDVAPALISLAPPARAAFAPPQNSCVFSLQSHRAERLNLCTDLVVRAGMDVLHTHLLGGPELVALQTCGIPHLTTVHNARRGWPHGLEEAGDTAADLFVACSIAVEKDLRSGGIRVPVRTVWNGIEWPASGLSALERTAARHRVGELYGIDPNAGLILSVANIRPQKRLERLASILARVQAVMQKHLPSKGVHLLHLGEPSSQSAAAAEAVDHLRREIQTSGVASTFHLAGSVASVGDFLAAADLLISVSDYEGLSLAHLEALSLGVPVVATSAGGTSEIGDETMGLKLVPGEASDELIAAEVAARIRDRPGFQRMTASHGFSLQTMWNRYLMFYQQLTEVPRTRRRHGMLLVINNLSVGGAQSSARRLLVSLQRRGYCVRAAVLQEDRDVPTPGRLDLESHGIPVIVLPKPGSASPEQAMECLVRETACHPPEVILLWNVMPGFKVRIVDRFLHTRVFDVSPGEMNFESLERFFERPVPGLPYRSLADYGAKLSGSVVKFAGEIPRAAATLNIPVHVIRNGIDVPDAMVQPQVRNIFVLGTAARVNPQKKIEDLLAAFRRALPDLPPCVLRIAGGVELGCEAYFAALQRQAEGLPVEWAGEIQVIRSFLQELDLFVMISHPAGCPNASLEAMSTGLPVIATDFGGMSEQIQDNVNGRLVPDGDVAAFASAMIELANDPQRRSMLGRAAKHSVCAEFSMTRMTDSYLQLTGLTLR